MRAARASTLRGWRGREALNELRLRRLQRDVRDVKRRLWALEVRRAIEDMNSPPLTPLPAAVEQPAAEVPPSPVATIDETLGRAIPTIAARGDEGLAPEGTSGGPAGSVRDRHPANASQSAQPAPTEGAAKPEPLPAPVVRAPIPRAERLPLPSGSLMDRMAGAFLGKPLVPLEPSDEAALDELPVTAPKVWCDGCDARVPGWFADDCISGACSLRGGKPKVRA